VHRGGRPFEREGHVGELVLDRLERTDRHVELLAFLRVREGHLEDAARGTDHLRGHARVSAVAPARVVGGGERSGLERRQVEQDVTTEAREIVADVARSAHERLLERSVEGVVSRPHSRELSGRTDDMFLNAAYLVPAGDETLREEAAALGRAYGPLHVTFEVTGPWPPYSFVGRPEREEVAG